MKDYSKHTLNQLYKEIHNFYKLTDNEQAVFINELIKRGIENPETFIQKYTKRVQMRGLLNGIVLIGLGVGYYLFSGVELNCIDLWSATIIAVPIFIGLGMISLYFYDNYRRKH